MIIVIADDFTGAAEIAGIGIQYGMKVTIQLGILKDTDAELLVVATNTRSMNREDAIKVMSDLKKEIIRLDYDWVFKKTDSVFRGHILAELNAILNVNNKKKALLVASNPKLGRTIIDGKYFINQKPLNETGFFYDPEYPTKTNDVLELLGEYEKGSVNLLSANDKILNDGIIVGQAGTLGDLNKLASKVTDDILPAGASGFFKALLENKGFSLKVVEHEPVSNGNKKYLIVQGSAYQKNRIPDEAIKNENIFVSYMPKEIFYDEGSSEKEILEWADSIVSKYSEHAKVLVGINEPVISDIIVSTRLREVIGKLTSRILDKVSIDELILEGGGTAYSVVSRLGYNTFNPITQAAPGVIRMSADENPNLCITLKPGSYKMPLEILYDENENKTNNKYLGK